MKCVGPAVAEVEIVVEGAWEVAIVVVEGTSVELAASEVELGGAPVDSSVLEASAVEDSAAAVLEGSSMEDGLGDASVLVDSTAEDSSVLEASVDSADVWDVTSVVGADVLDGSSSDAEGPDVAAADDELEYPENEVRRTVEKDPELMKLVVFASVVKLLEGKAGTEEGSALGQLHPEDGAGGDVELPMQSEEPAMVRVM